VLVQASLHQSMSDAEKVTQLRKTVLPGPFIGDINVLRLPWGPGIALAQTIAAAELSSDLLLQSAYGRKVTSWGTH
jgi:hypothetical protein